MDFFQSTADQLHTNETRSRNGAIRSNLGRVLDVFTESTRPFSCAHEKAKPRMQKHSGQNLLHHEKQ
nr:MAG TPA: hypothetical protein [Caudoviricetes sp.]DAQ34447.1 MAG TPA: hypothetical protein [Caudoviricetes sp.]